MKRFLHAGEGYVQNSLANRLLSPFKRYIQTSSPNKFGWLAYPSWVAKVTGIQFLVALFSSMLQYASSLTRLFLADSSSPSRRVVEAHSKDCRSPLEGLSKRSRTTVEVDSNNSRRIVEQVSKKLGKKPLKNQKSICSTLVGFFSNQPHYVSFGGFTLVKPRCKYLWVQALCGCLTGFLLCAQSVVAKEVDRGGGGEVLVEDSIQPLIVGDTLPLSFWQDFYGSVSADSPEQLPVIEDINSKLVIIYFWSPLCKPCIESLKKLDDILSDGVDQVVVIPILTNTPLELARRYSNRLQLNIPLIMTDGLLNDTYLSNYIPAWGGAWFYRGKFIAVPDLSGYTLEHVLKVLNGEDAEDQRGYPLGIASLIITD